MGIWEELSNNQAIAHIYGVVDSRKGKYASRSILVTDLLGFTKPTCSGRQCMTGQRKHGSTKARQERYMRFQSLQGDMVNGSSA